MDRQNRVTFILTGVIGGLALLYVVFAFASPSNGGAGTSESAYSITQIDDTSSTYEVADTSGLGDREPEGSCDGSCGGGCGGGCGGCGG